MVVVVVVNVRSSLSLSRLFCGGKKCNRGSRSKGFFLFMFRVLVKKNIPLSSKSAFDF